jgi:F-type H+-transporting ATPase subunit a
VNKPGQTYIVNDGGHRVHLWNLPYISIAPDTLFTIFGFPITNTLLCTWIVIAILLFLCYLGTRRQDLVPSGWQNAFEYLVEGLLGLVESVSGKKKGRMFFPFVASFFAFILIANLLDVIPGIDTIGQITSQASHAGLLFGSDSNEIIPWLRPPTTDLNLTIAMAVISVVATQFFGFAILGPKRQLSKYFNFAALKRGPMGLVDFVVGLLEIISESGRLVSFSFRLFGNIFAGGVLLAVFAFLVPVVPDILFIPFEIFVGAIQAFVFGFLTLVFMEVGTISHDHAESSTHEEGHEAIATH